MIDDGQRRCDHRPEHHHQCRRGRDDGFETGQRNCRWPAGNFGYILFAIWVLATIVPSLALSVRRLHDGNFSGRLLLVGLVSFQGALALLVSPARATSAESSGSTSFWALV